MKIACKTVGVLATFLLSASLLNAGEGVGKGRDVDNTPWPWLDYLHLAGQRLDCHFTIERIFRPENPGAAIYGAWIMDDVEIRSLEQLIAKVSKEVKGITFVRNRKNPAVVHVIDQRLKELDDYPLEAKLDVSYSGMIGDLSDELEKHLDSIGPRRGGVMSDAFDDHVTRVTVEAKNQQIRSILTDCVPLTHYGPRLWIAETRRVDGKTKTTVQYYGPDREKTLFWKKYLLDKADQLDCYFTVERMADISLPGQSVQWSSFSTSYVTRDQDVKTIEALVEKLGKQMLHVKVIRSGKNPAVIHLVEEPLLRIEGYLMEKKVDLTYSGTLGGLVTELGKRLPEQELLTDKRKWIHYTATQATVDVKNQTVREILTGGIPREQDRRCLWQSTTSRKDQKYSTIVE